VTLVLNSSIPCPEFLHNLLTAENGGDKVPRPNPYGLGVSKKTEKPI